MTLFGIHTNAQNKPLADLVEVWRHADQLGFDWISISDHFPGALGPVSNDAVVAHAALATSTTRVQCGVLCYSIGFRHPAVLASAVTTIDHLSGGRAAIGLGSGSTSRDYEIYGFPYPSLRVRTDMFDEAVQCVTALLHDESVRFSGEYFQLADATQLPRPVQARLPVWVGTSGERRGLGIAARHADGWNTAFVSAEEFARKRGILTRHCDDVGRDVNDIRCSVNLFFEPGTDPASIPSPRRDGALAGSIDEIVARVHDYEAAGADQVNFFLNYPWDFAALDALASALGLRSDDSVAAASPVLEGRA